jgi:hypothetical protein
MRRRPVLLGAVTAVALAGGLVTSARMANDVSGTHRIALASAASSVTPQVFPPLRGWFSYQQGNFVPGGGSYSIEAVTTTSLGDFASLPYTAFHGLRRGQVVIWVSMRYRPPIGSLRAPGSAFSLARAGGGRHAPCLFPGRPCLPGTLFAWVPHASLTRSHPCVSVEVYLRNRHPGVRLRKEIQARIDGLLVPNLA